MKTIFNSNFIVLVFSKNSSISKGFLRFEPYTGWYNVVVETRCFGGPFRVERLYELRDSANRKDQLSDLAERVNTDKNCVPAPLFV